MLSLQQVAWEEQNSAQGHGRWLRLEAGGPYAEGQLRDRGTDSQGQVQSGRVAGLTVES